MSTYEDKIVQAFKDLSAMNLMMDGESGASPTEVTELMAERGDLTQLDTVIDIERIMKKLRAEGRL